ncbi:hypothetical protein MG293_009545 [Ovis ammon polii]|uniref:Uncharacterized protein n=1 Tax=Ovis ammon polii TaxID=230172 RepID=A0AAD4YAB4_OVIAM|nr:hypothetical protein MG293_009545 [Ovis ammon polii]KAI4568175.1 hypothetical protein MJT46_007973 [Ovis ammon polii x Ovis aries]
MAMLHEEGFEEWQIHLNGDDLIEEGLVRRRRLESSSSGGDGGEVFGLRSIETPAVSGNEFPWDQIRHSDPKPGQLGRTRRCRWYSFGGGDRRCS